ncbi:MAG: cell division protein FtsA [Muribaculaceae bacterium]|nr:cell division protein FtsA [Muribaculaceae bacterium]
MSNKQFVVAIEIGSSKIVGAVAEKSSSGVLNVRNLEREDVKNCVRYGCVQNITTTRACVNRILTRLTAGVDGEIKSVFVGVGGRSVHSVMNEVNRPLNPSQPVAAEDVRRAESAAGEAIISGYETVDVEPRSYAIDKQVVTEAPVGYTGSQINVKVNLIVAKTALKLNLERAINDNNVVVRKYVVTPLAMGKQILTTAERTLGCMLVDIGAETTTVAIFKSDSLYYLATLPIGSRNISLDIAKGLSVLEEDAERVKKTLNNPLDMNAESVVIDGINSNEAVQYISARVGELVANIVKQISDSGLTAQDVKNIVLVGGGAQMNGLAHSLEEASKVKVRMAEQPQSINFLNHSHNRPEYIELFSIIATGADLLGDTDSCIEQETFNEAGNFNWGEQSEPETKPNDEPKPDPEPKPESKGSSWMKKLKVSINNLLSENDGDQ